MRVYVKPTIGEAMKVVGIAIKNGRKAKAYRLKSGKYEIRIAARS